MNESKKLVSFGNKLLLQVLSVVFVVFGVAMYCVAYYSQVAAEEDAEKYLKQMAGNYESQIEKEMVPFVTFSNGFKAKFESSLKTNTPLGTNEVIDYLKSILAQNPKAVGVWFNYKDTVPLFKKDLSKVDQKGYKKDGSFFPYVIRSKGDIVVDTGAGFNEKDEWTYGPMKAGKAYITKPYIYPVDGKDVLMATVGVPMYHNGQFIGSTGMDIALDTFAKMSTSLKIYENGYSFIVDDFGMILGHPEKSLLSKELIKVVNNDSDYVKLLKNAKEGKEYQFFKKSRNGLESFYYSKPFKIYGTDQHWSFIVNAPKDEYLSSAIFIRNFSMISVFAGLIIIAGIIYLSVKKLNLNLELISSGLENFFQYLNKKTQTTEPILINSNDEFGQMAKNINENIENIKKSLNEDSQLIENVKDIANNLSEGYINKKIEKSTSTPSLNELKEILNGMIDNLEHQVGKDINKTIEVLENYSNRNFIVSLDENNSGTIGREINNMSEMITQMLQNSQADGLNLKSNSTNLTQNIKVLSNNATSQAASLEETAASIDEITSNIAQTNIKAQEMLSISNETKISAQDGKNLANQTVQSMEDINIEVDSIKEAITVIDQIAFQTNILSLNAAVEAATAGEAGKGFAVVAQEVRNLAARSAEAANEIKALVESATKKANEGKNISSNMIQSFTSLESKIVDTSALINDVTHAASEQSIGMNQISDAINQLDRFTQQNASIAGETNSIALKTDAIAVELVVEVAKNNFKGKNN